MKQSSKYEKAQRRPPDAIKEAAAAAEQATEQAISDYAKVDAAAFAAMTKSQKGAYIQSLQELNSQLTEYLENLRRIESLDNIPTFPDNMPDYEAVEEYTKRTGKEFVSLKEFEEILPQCPDPAEQRADETELAALKSILPKKHVMPISKVANMLPAKVTGEKQKQGFDVNVSNRGKMNTRVIVALDDDNGNITFSGRPYTEYDRSVMDTIISLWLYGDESHNITPSMVYRAMTNKTQSEYISPQAVGAVTKSIEKMRHIFVRIDATDEFRKRGITDKNGNPIRARFNNYLLSATELELSAGGKTVNAYHIEAEPILYMYSKMDEIHPQCITVDASLLDVKEVKNGKITTVSLKNSDRLIVIRDHLLRRIKTMKRDRNENKKPSQSNRILFEDLYQKTGIDAENKKQTLNVRNNAIDVLDFFKAKGGLFKDYKIIKDGKTIKAIDIIF